MKRRQRKVSCRNKESIRWTKNRTEETSDEAARLEPAVRPLNEARLRVAEHRGVVGMFHVEEVVMDSIFGVDCASSSLAGGCGAFACRF